MELQQEALRKEEQEWSSKRKVFVDQLKSELKKLEDHKNDSHEALVTFLLEEMPPKHRPKEQWEHLLAESERVGWKKVMMKLVVMVAGVMVSAEAVMASLYV